MPSEPSPPLPLRVLSHSRSRPTPSPEPTLRYGFVPSLGCANDGALLRETLRDAIAASDSAVAAATPQTPLPQTPQAMQALLGAFALHRESAHASESRLEAILEALAGEHHPMQSRPVLAPQPSLHLHLIPMPTFHPHPPLPLTQTRTTPCRRRRCWLLSALVSTPSQLPLRKTHASCYSLNCSLRKSRRPCSLRTLPCLRIVWLSRSNCSSPKRCCRVFLGNRLTSGGLRMVCLTVAELLRSSTVWRWDVCFVRRERRRRLTLRYVCHWPSRRAGSLVMSWTFASQIY